MKPICLPATLLLCLSAAPSPAWSAPRSERARDLGIKIGRFEPGPKNAVTDVDGVRVGQVTLSSGDGKLVPGKGPVRTGVTVILPVADDVWMRKVAAGSFVLNGNGEVTGLMWLQESGLLETPIALTNTLSVGSVQKGLVDWMLATHPKVGITDDTLTPVVAECDDSTLNDIRGQHVKPEHVTEAIKKASSGPVEEGAVGAGTGMMTYEFKGGIGTSSRLVPIEGHTYKLGILLNANHGRRHVFRVLGAPVGQEIPDLLPKEYQEGSIIIVIATDAPLDGRQLSRLSKRVMLGIARTGAIASHGSGDVAIAFSTTNRIPHYPKTPLYDVKAFSDFFVTDLFEAAADAAEEALLNAMLAARTVVGRDGNTVYALPHDRLKAVLKKYGHPVP
jgi:D-aminopeptidase